MTRLRGVLYYRRRGFGTVRFQTQIADDRRLTGVFYEEYAQMIKGLRDPAAVTTNADLIASYKTSEAYSSKAQRTKEDYDKIMAFLATQIGHLPVADIQRRHVISLRDSNRTRVRFANYIVQMTRILMEHAIDIGIREHNPARGVSELKSTTPARQPWPQDLVHVFRDTFLHDQRVRLLFELLLGTGQRIGDVLAMQWGQISDGAIDVIQNKTRRRLVIPLTPHLQTCLDLAPRQNLTILTKLNGSGPWKYRGAADAMMAARRRIGAAPYPIHSLRHTTTSELAGLGLSDELIQSVTGHTSTASVRRYSDAARQKARAIIAQEKRK